MGIIALSKLIALPNPCVLCHLKDLEFLELVEDTFAIHPIVKCVFLSFIMESMPDFKSFMYWFSGYCYTRQN